MQTAFNYEDKETATGRKKREAPTLQNLGEIPTRIYILPKPATLSSYHFFFFIGYSLPAIRFKSHVALLILLARS